MKTKHIIALVVLLVIGLFLWSVFGKDATQDVDTNETASLEGRGGSGDAVDVALDFFKKWQRAERATNTDPYAEKLFDDTLLSLDLSKKLQAQQQAFESGTIDPVLCQSEVPEGFRTRKIFETEERTQLMVYPRDEQSSGQAVVTLVPNGDLWVLSDITCSFGEEAPETGEFNFENEGRLLRESLPERYKTGAWHLVYEKDGLAGHVAGLLLSPTSVCITQDGTEQACTDELFTETQLVRAVGNMTEAGVDVVRIEMRE